MTQTDRKSTVAVIGAGPAGLMAAEAAARAGARVTIYDQMPSPARKLLMAGKSGLNVTHTTPAFTETYAQVELEPMVAAFGPAEVRTWMEDLGQPSFVGSTGRVFPETMKASPLLRAWLARLDGLGVTLVRRACWTGWDGDALTFADGAQVTPGATVLALGGASWRRLGSDGKWTTHLTGLTAPFQPSNVGFRVAWSTHMAKHFGTPLKNIGLSAGGQTLRGEIVVSRTGLEGGGLYPLTPALRDGAPLTLDLKPDLTLEQVRARLAVRGKQSLSNHLRRALKLTPVQIALIQEWARPLPEDLAPTIKMLTAQIQGPQDMDQAISTAGGLRWEALDDRLMLRTRPGTFAAGEMLDWEAPTGGWLITACLATGRWAGRAAAAYAASP
ncbi:NAD(FAD)-utilizing dehydrogenase [Jannaschia pagri]|uniref:NAD(FAD)-utilizing dehydrogenase n=1 Tax=Jannaschia pagri TaxID=2829797 RepID=A0ABQ4NQ07_9RHOB|nr:MULTISPECIES: TIGR03862 family flavoprotein [unclassified Jannaschia]GIT92651.1 NAD(FAD)-utilizing dehydrogenase [Jannaschia sp. AI_61]GIT96489.1 NAD(FAD)-utilizing dehydrogenase [Jannaschia sp. AI_62]